MIGPFGNGVYFDTNLDGGVSVLRELPPHQRGVEPRKESLVRVSAQDWARIVMDCSVMPVPAAIVESAVPPPPRAVTPKRKRPAKKAE